MDRSISSRTLGRIGQIRVGEAATALLMLTYSFLAMASYNAIKPITRSKFIDSLGADNLPYVQLAAGLLIGIIMVAYSWLMARLPLRWSLPIVQVGIVGLLLAFWVLFHTGGTRVSVAFYVPDSSWGSCLSASSGPWPISFTIPDRLSACSVSSSPELRSEGLPVRSSQRGT